MGFYLIPPTTVGEAIYEVTIFESIAGSPGAVTIPTGASVRLDAWAAGVDALVSTISGGRPDFRNVPDAGGNAVTSTLDAAGNYALSAAPAGGYPVALIYVVRVALASYVLWTAAMRDQVLDIVGLHDLPAPAAGDLVVANAEPRWEALAHPGVAERVVESTAAGVQWAATTADGETNPSTVLRADASGDLRLRRIGLGVAPSYRIEATDTVATTGLANVQTAQIDLTLTGDGSGGGATHQAFYLDVDDDTTGDAVNYTYVQPFYLHLDTVAGARKIVSAQRLDVDSTLTGAGSSLTGFYAEIRHSANAGTLPTFRGIHGYLWVNTAGGTVTGMVANTGQTYVSANATVVTSTGSYANTTITNGSFTTVNLFSGRLYFATGTATTFKGLDLTDFTHASGTIGTGVGVDVGEVPGTTAYGLRSAVTAGANQYNLYISGTADNYFAGDVGIGTTPSYPLHVDGDYTSGSAYPAVIEGQGTDDVAPAVLLMLQNNEAAGAGYSAECHLRLDVTTRARRYVNFSVGETDDWVTGANASDPAEYILYCADGDHPCHRFWIQAEGYTAINAVDADAVRINYHLTDTITGTGGLEVYTGGGADPDLWWTMAAALTQYDGAGGTTGTLIDSTGRLGVKATVNTRYGITCNPAHTVVDGASQGGMTLQPTYTPAANSTSGVIGMYSQPASAGAANIGYVSGISGIAVSGSSGTLSSLYGLQFYARATAGAVTNTFCIWVKVENQSAGIMASAYGLYLDTATNTGGGSITTLYGIRILDQTAGGTNIGIRSAVSSGANKYNLYLDGTAVNYINGRVGVGLLAPAAMVHIDQSSTTGAIPVLTLDQADVDQVLMKIIGSADAASADRTLVAASDYGTPGALVGWVQVNIQDDGNRVADADYYVPFYAVPT